jgi:hypothetical protein
MKQEGVEGVEGVGWQSVEGQRGRGVRTGNERYDEGGKEGGRYKGSEEARSEEER